MGGTQLTAEHEAASNEIARRRFRLASPTTAVVLGVLGVVGVVLRLPLTQTAHHLHTGSAGLGIFGLLALCLPGIVIARRQPANPIGWILIGIGVGLGFYVDVETYSLLDYHLHHGDLPFGPAAVLVASDLCV